MDEGAKLSFLCAFDRIYLVWLVASDGSNPSLSATQSGVQRNSAVLSPEIRQICPFLAIIPQQTGPQRTDCSAENWVTDPIFLWRADARSGFEESIRRMQCDHKPGIWPCPVDVCPHFGKLHSAFPARTLIATNRQTLVPLPAIQTLLGKR
jgi:hypothetical protein